MKNHLLSILLLVACHQSIYASSYQSFVKNSEALIQRVLPEKANHFVIEQISSEHGKDVFEIAISENGKIVLRGNNELSVAMAFNRYLRDVAHVSYDWFSVSPLQIKGELPLPISTIRMACSAQERFFNNTCTFGYTFPFWNWERWEKFIDWLAMNGVNRPLMLAGQEKVWLNVWQSFGLKKEDIQAYFSGPAHLPWHRMANLDKWGGPLPVSYIECQYRLQKKILARCRELAMEPVLPAFAGHVPEQLKQVYPEANIHQISPGWGGMDADYTTYFLDPSEKLFSEIQYRFLKEQEKLYGISHRYSADPFNEIDPPSWAPEYIASVAKTIYRSMKNADPEAIWYQMSWTFYYDSEHWTQERLKAMVESVPKGKLIFLDYVAEEEEFYKRTENFFGAPFIWCYLGNFGGNTHLVAPMKKVSKRIVEALKVANCLGVGATLEGLNVNPEIYEMVLEIPCNNKISSFDIDEWIKNYAVRRAGQEDSAVIEAWKLLKEKVLVDEAQVIGNHSVVFQVLPVMDLKESSWTTNPFVPYDNADLAKALQIMLQANEESRKNDAYCFDVVNLARQALGNYGSCLYEKMMTAYREQNLSDFQKYSHQFISLGMEIDLLLGTRKEFLLGSWLSDARRWGKTREEKIYYERNAREIITTWHKSGGELVDYANRQWNGLMRSYYLPRWEKFIELLQKSLINGTSFEQEDFSAWCIDFERKWVNGEIQENFLEKPSGNAIETAQRLFEKYSTEMLK